jgi:hypothetical protein
LAINESRLHFCASSSPAKREESLLALTLSYRYRGKEKTSGYANDKHLSMFEAVAAAEGINLDAYKAMEQQVQASTRDKTAHRDFRDNYFKGLGFEQIQVIREQD